MTTADLVHPTGESVPALLSSGLQDHARRYVAARRRSGEALLEAVAELAAARAEAARGEWGVFLEAIGLDESAARAQLRIHELAQQDATYAERIRTGFLTEATAREVLALPPETRATLLDQAEPPTRAEIREAKREPAPALTCRTCGAAGVKELYSGDCAACYAVRRAEAHLVAVAGAAPGSPARGAALIDAKAPIRMVEADAARAGLADRWRALHEEHQRALSGPAAPVEPDLRARGAALGLNLERDGDGYALSGGYLDEPAMFHSRLGLESYLGQCERETAKPKAAAPNPDEAYAKLDFLADDLDAAGWTVRGVQPSADGDTAYLVQRLDGSSATYGLHGLMAALETAPRAVLVRAGWRPHDTSPLSWIGPGEADAQGLLTVIDFADHAELAAAAAIVAAEPTLSGEAVAARLTPAAEPGLKGDAAEPISADVRILAEAYGLCLRPAEGDQFWLYWPGEEAQISGGQMAPFDVLGAREWLIWDAPRLAAQRAPQSLSCRALAAGYDIRGANSQTGRYIVSVPGKDPDDTEEIAPLDLQARIGPPPLVDETALGWAARARDAIAAIPQEGNDARRRAMEAARRISDPALQQAVFREIGQVIPTPAAAPEPIVRVTDPALFELAEAAYSNAFGYLDKGKIKRPFAHAGKLWISVGAEHGGSGDPYDEVNCVRVVEDGEPWAPGERFVWYRDGAYTGDKGAYGGKTYVLTGQWLLIKRPNPRYQAQPAPAPTSSGRTAQAAAQLVEQNRGNPAWEATGEQSIWEVTGALIEVLEPIDDGGQPYDEALPLAVDLLGRVAARSSAMPEEIVEWLNAALAVALLESGAPGFGPDDAETLLTRCAAFVPDLAYEALAHRISVVRQARKAAAP